MKTVFVTKWVPWPARGGGELRVLAIVERLAARGPVVLCGFAAEPGAYPELDQLGVEVRAAPWPPPRRALAAGLARTRTVSSARFWSPELFEHVRASTANPPDLLFVNQLHMAPYAAGIEAGAKVLDLNDVASDLFRRYAGTQTGLRRLAASLEAIALRRLEQRSIEASDAVSVVSTIDLDRLPRRPARPIVAPNGWEPTPALPPSSEPIVVFVAQLGWAPNVDAAVWFARAVWPLVTAAHPGARLFLVGRDPTPAVQSLAAPTVVVTGSVPDVNPFLRRACLAVAPLRAGGGTRLKILEALNAGRPVVASTIGAEGLETLVGRGVIVADDPRAIATEILALLDAPAAAAELGSTGHAQVADHYSWDTTLAVMLDAIIGVTSGSEPRHT